MACDFQLGVGLGLYATISRSKAATFFIVDHDLPPYFFLYLPCRLLAMSSLEQIINDPAYHDYFAILKGLRNGLVYGVKIRFPHALLMSILFGRGE